MEKNGETLHDKIRDKPNIFEETIVQFKNEIKYQTCGSFKYF